jgi:hypothetical protein
MHRQMLPMGIISDVVILGDPHELGSILAERHFAILKHGSPFDVLRPGSQVSISLAIAGQKEQRSRRAP